MATVVITAGTIGPQVKKLQLLLNSALHPSPHLSMDGVFGPATTAAVQRFQRERGLAADGVVGPRTWEALGQKGTALPSETYLSCRADTPWLEIAAMQLGVHEDSRPGHHNTRIVTYHQTTTLRATTDEVPWCSSFVNWVMTKARYTGTGSAAARSWLNWGIGLPAARPGAITVIRRKKAGADAATGSSSGYHVAFLISQSASHVRLLGGNQSDSVKYSNFALESYRVEGYRWPT